MKLPPNNVTNPRRNRYKVAGDAEDRRRRRQDDMIEIRKNKREESLQKKRDEGLPSQFPEVENKTESLSAMVAAICSNDASEQLKATTLFREMLSKELNPPIEEIIQSGVVPHFVEFLIREDMPKLQIEAAWALANIASGTSENTKVVIDLGAVPRFVSLLSSPNNELRDQAVWALGNIAGDSPECRDLVLGQGALGSLLPQLKEHATGNQTDLETVMLRNASWTLSNFCRGKPQPIFGLVKPMLPVLQLLIWSIDPKVLINVCWALSYLSDTTNGKIQEIIEAGVCNRLVQLLQHPSASVLIPAVRTVGNIVTGDDMQIQLMINLGALRCLLSLLTHNHEKSIEKSIKKEACWTISNITAGTKEQIQAVIEAGLIAPLVSLLQNAEFEIKKEAAWAITNAISGGIDEQIKYLVGQGCIKPLCDLLVCSDSRIITVCLDGLENILNVGEAEKSLGNSGGSNLYTQMIEDSEGLEKIEKLQYHDNPEIYERAVKLLETFWLEDEMILPSGIDDQFGFKASVPSGGFNFN